MDFGPDYGSRNVHTGQGTANRRFFFEKSILELIWVRDATRSTNSSPTSWPVTCRIRACPIRSRSPSVRPKAVGGT